LGGGYGGYGGCYNYLRITDYPRTVHPPAGANPLIMIQGHASFTHIGLTVIIGISIITVVAWIWSRLGFGLKKYPVSWIQPSPPTTNWSIWGD